MEKPHPFNEWLDRKTVRAKTSVANSAPEIRDMLEGAWKAAQSVFGKAARPEHAITMLPIFLARADAERQRLRDEIAARTTAETTPPSKRRVAPPKDR